MRDLFSGLTDEEFAQLVKDVQMGVVSIPVVLVIEEPQKS
jgi:hypothetical protein